MNLTPHGFKKFDPNIDSDIFVEQYIADDSTHNMDKIDEVITAVEHDVNSGFPKTIYNNAEGSYLTIGDSQDGYIRETVVEGKSRQVLNGQQHDQMNGSIGVKSSIVDENYYITKGGFGANYTRKVISTLPTFTLRCKIYYTSESEFDVKFAYANVNDGSNRINSKTVKITPTTTEKIEEFTIEVDTTDGLFRNGTYLFVDKTAHTTPDATIRYRTEIVVDNITTPSADLPIPIESVADEDSERINKIEISSTGKNLLNIENPAYLNVAPSEYLDVPTSSIRVVGDTMYSRVLFKTKLPPATKCTFKCFAKRDIDTGSSAITVTDSNTTTNTSWRISHNIIGVDKKEIIFTFTTPEKILDHEGYIYIYLYTNYGTPKPFITCLYENITVSIGTGMTYAPYQGKTSTTQFTAPLRSLPNGLKDEFHPERGEVVRKCIQLDMNASNFISNEFTLREDMKTDNTTVFTMLLGKAKKGTNNTLCNRLPAKYTKPWDKQYDDNCISSHPNTDYIWVKIRHENTGILDTDTPNQKVDKLRAYFENELVSGTPFVIQYELVELAIEKVPPSYIPTYENCTNVYTTDKLQPNMKVKYSKTLPNILEENYQKSKTYTDNEVSILGLRLDTDETAIAKNIEDITNLKTTTEDLDKSVILLNYEMGSNYSKAQHKDVQGSYVTVSDAQDGYARETVIEGQSRQVIKNAEAIVALSGGGDSGYNCTNIDGLITKTVDDLGYAWSKFNHSLVGKMYESKSSIKVRMKIDSPVATSCYFQAKRKGGSICSDGHIDVSIPLKTGEQVIEVTFDTSNVTDIVDRLEMHLYTTNLSIGQTMHLKELSITADITTPSPDLTIPFESVADPDAQGVHKIENSSCGKNLFDAESFVSNVISNGLPSSVISLNNGTIELKTYPYTERYAKYDLINFKNNTYYTIKFNYNFTMTQNASTSLSCYFYYHDGTYDKYTLWQDKNSLVMKSAFAKQLSYIAFGGWLYDGIVNIDSIQLEEGTTATPYEPYQGKTNTTQFTAPLRSLPNGINDEFYLESGEVVRRISYLELTGGERVVASYNPSVTDSDISIIFYVIGCIGANGTVLCVNEMMCNQFKLYNCYTAGRGDDYGFCTHNGKDLIFRVKRELLTTQDTNGFKQFLKQQYDNGNPVTVLYEAKTPTIETVPKSYIPVYENCTNVYTTDKLQPNIRFKYPINIFKNLDERLKALEVVAPSQAKMLTNLALNK